MQTSERFDVALMVYKHENPQEISEKLRLKPTWIGYTGNVNSKGFGKLPHNIWSLQSELPETDEMEDHIASLLKRLHSVEDKAYEIFSNHRTVISVGARYSYSNHQVELDPSILSQLGQLNITLWLDMYMKAEKSLT